jgi:hypothetical protein
LGDYLQNRPMPKVDFRKEVVHVALAELLEQRRLSEGSCVCACTVRFSDCKGIEHSTEVRAASVYEAACRAWANFKSIVETEEESYKAKRFIIEVHQDPKVFHVELEKLLEWLDRGRHGSRDNPRKQWLRRLLDASIWGPPTAEEESRAARGQSV